MITLPIFDDSFTYENMFYLSCNSDRLEKLFLQYSIFKKSLSVSGSIVECGVFKGASFSRFAMFRKIHNIEYKYLIGFDSFMLFPETSYADDQELRREFIEIDGLEGVSVDQLRGILDNKKCSKNVELIKGNICKTVPSYVKNQPNMKISFINLDVDVYEPSKVVLEYLYPMLSSGGVILLDNYNEFPGETKAVNDYFNDKGIDIKEKKLNRTQYYIIKP
jgi:hypothetical protein